MDLLEAMEARHSVRVYKDKPMGAAVVNKLNAKIEKLNAESGLHMQLVCDEPHCFSNIKAMAMGFKNADNYVVLAGKNDEELQEKCGYYGEKLVLYAQQLGLNTCWVKAAYSKHNAVYELKDGEKICLMIVIGYGENAGTQSKSKIMADVSTVVEYAPKWFENGVKAALLAPTAMNEQKFFFTYRDGVVYADPGKGPMTKIDLGIAKCHFEIAAGAENVNWGTKE